MLTKTKSAELGYAMDSAYYGIGNYNEDVKTALSKLTVTDVNAAIKRHLRSDNMHISGGSKGHREAANRTNG